MARFKITLLMPDGKLVEDIVEAESEDELLSLYSQGEALLIEYRRDIFSSITDFLKNLSLSRSKRISKQELADFCFYMGRALDMGIPILEIIDDMKESTKNKYFKDVLERLKNLIASGHSLAEAMRLTNAFPGELIGLVKVGEETDALPRIFLNYAQYLDWVIRLQKEVKQALSYPSFVIVVLIFTIGITFGYIIPQVIPAIKAMGLKEYPLPTKILLWSGFIFRNFWKEILTIPIITLVLLRILLSKSKKIRILYDKYKLKVPLIGDILLKSALARDIRVIAEVYRSGGTLLNAIDLIINYVEQNLFLKTIFQQVRENLLAGNMLSEAMKKTNFFEPTIIRMTKLGEDTGALDKSLIRVADIYEDDMKRKIQVLVVMIEPSLQFALGAILGLVALGILMPVYDVMSRIGNG